MRNFTLRSYPDDMIIPNISIYEFHRFVSIVVTSFYYINVTHIYVDMYIFFCSGFNTVNLGGFEPPIIFKINRHFYPDVLLFVLCFSHI